MNFAICIRKLLEASINDHYCQGSLLYSYSELQSPNGFRYNCAHYAALSGHNLALVLLLDAAATDLLTRSGVSPPYSAMHLAAYNGHTEALQVCGVECKVQ